MAQVGEGGGDDVHELELVPEGVGDAQGQGSGVPGQFGTCLQGCDKSVCSLAGGWMPFFERSGVEEDVAVEDGRGEGSEVV